MILVNLSVRRFQPRRRARNEAFFHYLLADAPELTSGIFVNRAEVALAPPPGGPAEEELLRGEIEGKPFRVLQPWPHAGPGQRVPEIAAAYARRFIEEELGDDELVLLVNSAYSFAYHVAMALLPRARLSLLDLSDDFSTWPVFGIEQRTRALVAAVDRVIYVNERTRARLPHPAGRVFVNGCDWPNYRRDDARFERPPLWPKPAGARYVGFLGGLFGERFDLALIDALAQRLPELTFLFVGPAWDPGLPARLGRHPNVVVVDEVPAEALPVVVGSFDAGIVPFLVNAVTSGSDLLKVLDYLAAGVPVVSTPCAGVERHGAVVRVEHDLDGFVRAVAETVERRGEHDPAPGLRVAEAMAWRPRLRELADWIFARSTSS